jgi:IS30 family transposase
MRASEFITEGSGYKLDQDTIDLVKMLWDEGKKTGAIADDLGLSFNSVNGILRQYYPSRPGKLLKLGSALTDDDKNTIVSRFINQDTPTEIAKDYGIYSTTVSDILQRKLSVDKYNDIMEPRKKLAGTRVSYKVTPEILNKIKELYVAGKSFRDISAHLDNLISSNNVYMAMARQPDYAELRAKRDERTRKVKHSPVATTNKTPAGIGDNQRSKGPRSRHTSGVNWPKYG